MVGEILLKMMSVLTPDDVREIKAVGCGDDFKAILATWDWMAIHCRVTGVLESKVWADVRAKLPNIGNPGLIHLLT